MNEKRMKCLRYKSNSHSHGDSVRDIGHNLDFSTRMTRKKHLISITGWPNLQGPNIKMCFIPELNMCKSSLLNIQIMRDVI